MQVPSIFAALLFLLVFCPFGGAAGANRPDSASPAEVLTGLDVLEREGFERLKGQRVGLIANHSSINRHGEHLLDLALGHGVRVVALFSPEHGFRGTADEKVEDGVDVQTGLPIYSLYGETRVPTDESLEDIDTLVFDIQDIGARFYTYNATMGECMRKAAEHDIRFVVLDRPNPIRGTWFDGPVQDDDLLGRFTAFVKMPIVHGMTLGEIASMYRQHHAIEPELDVVPLEGWSRSMYFDETGLPWVNPSPNMRSVNQELLYTMVALTEAEKTLSVGRGTERPFEYLGAPWIEDGKALADEMNARGLPGLWFMETTFMPRELDVTGRRNYPYQFTEEVCHGFRVVVTDRHVVNPVVAGFHMLDALLKLYGERYSTERLRGLVGAGWALEMLNERAPVQDIVERWRADPEFQAFAARRASVLLYD